MWQFQSVFQNPVTYSLYCMTYLAYISHISCWMMHVHHDFICDIYLVKDEGISYVPFVVIIVRIIFSFCMLTIFVAMHLKEVQPSTLLLKCYWHAGDPLGQSVVQYCWHYCTWRWCIYNYNIPDYKSIASSHSYS